MHAYKWRNKTQGWWERLFFFNVRFVPFSKPAAVVQWLLYSTQLTCKWRIKTQGNGSSYLF